MVYVIADLSSNWMGSIEFAKKLIAECDAAGVDAIKMQYWDANLLYDETHPYWEMIVQVEMNFDKMRILHKYTKERNMDWFTSTFDNRGIDFLAKELKVPYFKLAGCVTSCMGLQLEELVAPYDKWVVPFELMLQDMAEYPQIPVIASIDVSNVDQATLKQRHDGIKRHLPKSDIYWLMTHSLYPLETHKVTRLGLTIFNQPSQSSFQKWKWAGLSDHTQGAVASLYAVARGASIIERHVATAEQIRTNGTQDACVSITPEELKALVHSIRKMEYLEKLP